MKPITRDDALAYHRQGNRPGKIEVRPSKPLESQYDLSLAYTPGVAYPVLEIDKHPELAYDFTNKGNLVAVISNGTAILGLGNRGALASKPVMEGKAVLFKKFSGIDVYDIEINVVEPEAIVQVVAAIAPGFGGINLEDIRSPECFWIERRLQELLDIPVFHDDQHGTAIIVGAALLNALSLTDRKLEDVKVVFSGAGAAAIACAGHLIRLGVCREHIWMTDIAGLVYHGRQEEMFPEKEFFAQLDRPASLAQVLQDADVFIGLSAGDIVTPEMIRQMAPRPVIFAMANPYPEIRFEIAKAARPDAIIGTGRSDYPNQVNNVLGFPFIFRGALDVRAWAINDAMKIAASHALAELARQPVPADVLHCYGLDHLEFSADYIVPKPLDRRVCAWESTAVARAAIESGVARQPVDLTAYQACLEDLSWSC